MSPFDYFQTYDKYFWSWEEETDVIVMYNGATIAYTAEVSNHLMALGENGLPPFGSVLMAIIATNQTYNDGLTALKSLLFQYEQDSPVNMATAFQFLEKLQSLNSEYKVGKMRNTLLRTIFDNSHNRVNRNTSKGLLVFFKNDIKRSSARINRTKPFRINVLNKDLRVFELLNSLFPTTQSIVDAMGISAELTNEELPLIDTTTVSGKNYDDFVEQLKSDSQTFQIGSLIKPIWGGFNIPIFNAQPSEQPLGGISDLSNKGDFDKLLVSEFANDDIVFMSRLANREALFMHREMPPISDKLQRIILIDVSLKTWGVPKILAYAFSLAIAKHPKSLGEPQIFAVGDNFYSIDYGSISKLILGLQKVTVAIDSSAGIMAFLKEFKLMKHLEIFFITSEDLIENQNIRKIFYEYNNLFKYVITTSLNGEIHFLKNKNSALKLLDTIKLDLNQLWKKGNKPILYRAKDDDSDLRNYSILYPIPTKINKRFSLKEEFYFVSNRFLFRHYNSEQYQKGCELILADIPSNGIYKLGRTNSGELLFLIFNPANKEVRIINLKTCESVRSIFVEWRSGYLNEFIFYENYFMYLKPNNALTYKFIPSFGLEKIDIEVGVYEFERFNTITPEPSLDIKEVGKTFNILKNVKLIYIDSDNVLVFNSLQLTINNIVLLSQVDNNLVKLKVSAIYNSDSKSFIFPDGSEIIVNALGMFILKSKNKEIPTIYISSTINTGIGMAADIHFSGDPYYLKLPFISFRLNVGDSQKLVACKILKSYMDCSLSSIKKWVDNSPSDFSCHMKLEHADKMAKDLKELGVSLSYYSDVDCDKVIIPTDLFYNTYISKFIEQIIQYGNSN